MFTFYTQAPKSLWILVTDPTPCYGFIQDYHKILLSEEKPPPKIFSFPQNML